MLLVFLALLVLPWLLGLATGPVHAQGSGQGPESAPWCTVDLLAPSAQPYPAPTWSQLAGVPDYETVSKNLKLAESLRFLASILDKALQELQSGATRANVSDLDGTCLCNCGGDAAFYKDLLRDAVRDGAQQALKETRDVYLQSVEDRLLDGRQVLFEAAPSFRQEVEGILQTTCNDLVTCDASDPGAVPAQLYEQASQVVEDSIDALFQEKREGLEALLGEDGQLDTDVKALKKDLEARLDEILEGLKSGKLPKAQQLGQDLDDIVAEVDRILIRLGEGALELAQVDPGDWKSRIEGDLQTWLQDTYDNDAAVWQAMEQAVLDAAEARIDAVREAAEELVATATDLESAYDTFEHSFVEAATARLGEVDGCYGTTTKAECSLQSFCAGTQSGHFLGQEKLELPLWFPTEVFKDGKTALLWALETVDWLDAVKKHLEEAEPPELLKKGGVTKLSEVLKNGAELLEKLGDYVDTYTTGYHLGGYNTLRADLHHCVGWAGHGVMAELFSTRLGKKEVRGGASYLSANLSERHRAQFRSGGLVVQVGERTLPLAPGVSLDLQLDGFRLWSRDRPFGIGPDVTGGQVRTADVAKYDAFHLIDQGQLEAFCGSRGTPCTLSPTDFLYKSFYPVSYTQSGQSRIWPREPSLGWEEDHPLSAVFGAGLDLDLEMKTYRWDGPSWTVFPGATVSPWFSLDAGAHWRHETNALRETLRTAINKNLPASLQLDESGFARDDEAFQAPDVTDDVGHGAFVEPRLGANLHLGLKLGKRFRVGIAADLYVGVRVTADATGGVLDLHRSLVDTLAQSNPPGDDCQPVVEDTRETVCSNTWFQPRDPCADTEPDTCIDLSEDRETSVVSTGEYSCDGGDNPCEGKGFCQQKGKGVVGHDVTRSQCEGTRPDRRWRDDLCCFQGGAPTNESPAWGGLTAASCADRAEDLGVEAAFFPGRWYYTCEGAITESAEPDPECEHTVHCFTRRTDGGYDHEYLIPDPEGSVFVPYQCVETVRPEITGYEGPDCHPLEFGYPSACPGEDCSCEPGKTGTCAEGEVCVDGACLTACTGPGASPDLCSEPLACGPDTGACEMANGLPFAEQIAWRLRDSSAPQHSIASYALQRLIADLAIGYGVKVGLEYKLFRKWKEKNLLDVSDSLSKAFPFVHHQLGLEARYQNECRDDLGPVINHQPERVKRHPGGGIAPELAAWCKPAMAGQVDNPPPPDSDEVIASGLENVHQFGIDVGVEYWKRAQRCVDGVAWDRFFTDLESSPDDLWSRLRCSYRQGVRELDLDCADAQALERSLIHTLGCLDVSGGASLPQSRILLRLLQQRGLAGEMVTSFQPTSNGQPVGPARQVLALDRILLDPEELFTGANLAPAIRQLSGQPVALRGIFSAQAWLQQIDACLADAPSGRFDEGRLTMDLDLEITACGGACCDGGACRQVAHPDECAGSFWPARTCAEVPGGCALPSEGGGGTQEIGGACAPFGECQEVASEGLCLGAPFHLGATCAEVNVSGSLCRDDSDCAAGDWCRPTEAGGAQCVPRVGEGARCGGFVLPWTRERCAPDLICTDFPLPDIPGFCRRPCTEPPVGQTAWWPLDGIEQGRTPEAFGGPAAFVLEAPDAVPGRVGGALAFDGETDALEVADHPSLDLGTGDLSFTFWIRTRERRNNSRLVLDRLHDDVGYRVYLLRGALGIQLGDGTATPLTSNVQVADGRWHHVAVTVDRDRTDGVRWYLDGRPAATANPTRHQGSISSRSPMSARSPLWIGALEGEHLHARMELDELAIYRRALRAEEVTDLHRAGAAGVCRCAALSAERGPLAWWPMDRGGLVEDLADGAWGAPRGEPQSVPGRVAEALRFDGDDDFVEVDADRAPTLGRGDFSWAGWIRWAPTAPRVQILVDQRRGGRGYQVYLWRGRLGLQLADGSYTNYNSEADLSDGAWHHVAVTVDRDDPEGIRFFLDGAASDRSFDPTGHRGSLDSGAPLRIARFLEGSGAPWAGEVDELMVFDRVLGAWEIRRLHAAGGFGLCTGARPQVAE